MEVWSSIWNPLIFDLISNYEWTLVCVTPSYPWWIGYATTYHQRCNVLTGWKNASDLTNKKVAKPPQKIGFRAEMCVVKKLHYILIQGDVCNLTRSRDILLFSWSYFFIFSPCPLEDLEIIFLGCASAAQPHKPAILSVCCLQFRAKPSCHQEHFLRDNLWDI